MLQIEGMSVKVIASRMLRLVTGIVRFLVVIALGFGNVFPAWSAPVSSDQQRVVVGTFSLDFNRDWQLLASEETRAILQARSRTADGGCPGRLILATGDPFFKAAIPELPSYPTAWGKLILVSPNASLTGYAATPQEHGLALYQNRLRIEYWCLNDLRAIERIAQFTSTK